MQNSVSKDFIETFPTCFSQSYLNHFSKRPYSHIKTILVYLYTIKAIKFITTLSFGVTKILNPSNKQIVIAFVN